VGLKGTPGTTFDVTRGSEGCQVLGAAQGEWRGGGAFLRQDGRKMKGRRLFQAPLRKLNRISSRQVQGEGGSTFHLQGKHGVLERNAEYPSRRRGGSLRGAKLSQQGKTGSSKDGARTAVAKGSRRTHQRNLERAALGGSRTKPCNRGGKRGGPQAAI